MDQFYFELVILAVILFGVYYFTNQAQEVKERKHEWKLIKQQAEQVRAALATQFEYLKAEQARIAAQPVINEREALVAISAIMAGAQLAKQTPAVHSATHLKDKFYHHYDETCMSCLFLSASDYNKNPTLYRNALFVVIYGQTESDQYAVRIPFYRIYANDGQLLAAHEYPPGQNSHLRMDTLLDDITHVLAAQPTDDA